MIGETLSYLQMTILINWNNEHSVFVIITDYS